MAEAKVLVAEVQSFSGAKRTYRVMFLVESKQLTCSCPAWIYSADRQPCKHITAASAVALGLVKLVGVPK